MHAQIPWKLFTYRTDWKRETGQPK